MIIRKMTQADIPAVLEVDINSFHKPWKSESFMEELCKDYSDYFVIEEQGDIVGYAGIWSIYETAELMRIAVMTENRGKGYAKALMEKLVATARERGCERMVLEVRKSNSSAQMLYKRFGFCELTERKGYYDGEDAVIMEAKIG